MLAFIKNNSLIMLRKKLCLLYLLNVADIIFTVLLLRTGYFTEVNYLMSKMIQKPFVCIMIKVIFPIILLYYIYKQMEASTAAQLRASNVAINISLFLYAFVNATHLLWTAALPFLVVFHA
jgi:hypothetical protein